MKDQHDERKPASTVIAFPTARARKRAPRFAGGAAGATAGGLALKPGVAPLAERNPLRFPAPSRWFSESHGAIGFRLFDIVYMFSLARQALTATEAVEWGCRYFSGAWSEEHGRTVLDILAPGSGDDTDVRAIPDHIRQGFRDAICQGASRLLGRPKLQAEDITWDDAVELQKTLETVYDRNGWLLPSMPLTLHRMLRYSKDMYDY
jgi:hypothetical protein